MSDRQRLVFMPKKETWTYQFLMNIFYITAGILFLVSATLAVAGVAWVGRKIDVYINTSDTWASIVLFFTNLPVWLNIGIVVVIGIIVLAAIITIVNHEP